jgi:hypothetical protein
MLRWRRLCLGLLASLVIASNSGCSVFRGVSDYIAYNDACNDFVIGWRNEVWARQSWHENKACFADQAYLRDFGQGYRDGYMSVAAGGNGCPPPIPPRCYWSWHYQSGEGQGKVAAWFAGFPHGAAAAERDNAGEWQEIQVSHHIHTQYSPEFQDGTIFLPEDLMDEARCTNRPEPTRMPPMANPSGLPPLAPEADPLYRPAPDDSAFAVPPQDARTPWAAPVPSQSQTPANQQFLPAGHSPVPQGPLGNWLKHIPLSDATEGGQPHARPDLAYWQTTY